MSTTSQTTQILAHLEKGRSLTPLKALHQFGSIRLAARIYDLKQQGHPIVKEWETRGDKRYARYSMPAARR